MDIARVLEYLGYTNWQVVDNKITEFEGKKPSEKQLQVAWEELSVIIENERIDRERRQRYEEESDHLLYEALMKIDIPELTEWKNVRNKIKLDLPKNVNMGAL